MCETFLRPDHVGARTRLARIRALTRKPGATHAGCEIDNDIGIAAAYAFDDIGEQVDIARTLASLWIADVDVRDGCAGLRGADDRAGDLFRGDRQVRMFLPRVSGAGDSAGDNDVSIHFIVSYCMRNGSSIGSGEVFSQTVLTRV